MGVAFRINRQNQIILISVGLHFFTFGILLQELLHNLGTVIGYQFSLISGPAAFDYSNQTIISQSSKRGENCRPILHTRFVGQSPSPGISVFINTSFFSGPDRSLPMVLLIHTPVYIHKLQNIRGSYTNVAKSSTLRRDFLCPEDLGERGALTNIDGPDHLSHNQWVKSGKRKVYD